MIMNDDKDDNYDHGVKNFDVDNAENDDNDDDDEKLTQELNCQNSHLSGFLTY